MTSPLTKHAPELEASVLTTLLRRKKETGFVSNKDVQNAASVLGCSTRRIRRMIERGYVRARRSPWKPDADLTMRLVRHKGSVAQMHKVLCEQKKDPGVSPRTMQRYFATQYDQRLLAGARGGYKAMLATLPTLERHTLRRNEEWAIDHTQLPVWVRLADGTIVKPWMTTIIDAATRMIMAFTISPQNPTTEESVETVALAVEGFTTEDGIFVGGQPETLHSDRGSDLVTHAMTLGLIVHGTARSFSEAYTPQQNGKIERWHRTLKDEILPLILGYDRSDWVPNDPRVEPTPVLNPAGILPIEALWPEIAKPLRAYNFERFHRALDKTPFQAWCDQEQQTPITRVDPQAIRASMTQHLDRTVRRARVQWEKRFYQLPNTRVPEGRDPETGETRFGEQLWKQRLEGKPVQMRFLPTRIEYVEVYTTYGEYVGQATWTNLLDASESAQALADRRKAIRTMRTSLADIAKAEAEAKQAMKDEATAAEPSEDDKTYGPRPSTAKPRKRAESAGATKRKATEKARTRTDHAAVTATVLARTGTDDF
jgi:transposase InsO family protein